MISLLSCFRRIQIASISFGSRGHLSLIFLTCLQDWHQKLHNNTTPDDVAICEAYIAFLQNKGDVSAYWKVMSDAGNPPVCNDEYILPSAPM